MRLLIRRAFLITALCFIFAAPGTAGAAAETGKVLLIDLPRLTYSDISGEYPNLLGLINKSAAGILSLPITDPLTPDKVYYELNCGSQIKTIDEGKWVFDATEIFRGGLAGDLYRGLTGYAPPSGGGVNLGLPKVIFTNNNEPVLPNFGLVGKILHENSLKTAAIGNADTGPENPDRSGAVLLMDELGRIDYAALGPEVLMPDSRFPFGVRTNPEQIITFWRQFRRSAAITVITLGDLERINAFGNYLSASRMEFHRRRALLNYDRLLGRLLAEIDLRSTLVVVFSVAGPDYDQNGLRLSPVFFRGSRFRPGLLYSNSTRRPAIITGYDLIATTLAYAGAPSNSYPKGRGLYTSFGNWRTAAAAQVKLNKNYYLRWPLLTVYGYMNICLAVGLIAGLLFWRRRRPYFKWLENIYLFLMTLPVVFLIEALFNPVDWLPAVGLTLVLAGILFYVCFRLAKRDQFQCIYYISLVTILAILADGLSNGYLELSSFLGYSAVSGARFYGIGNEYLGFFLGAFITVLSLALTRTKLSRKEILWAAALISALLLAHPNCGANVGGGITALVGLGLTTFLWLKKPVGLKEILWLGIALLVFLTLVGIWDLSLDGRNTHFGQLINSIREEGLTTVKEIIYRKWRMNLSLINYTPLSWILIGLIFAIPPAYKRPPRAIAGLMEKYPYILKGFFGMVLTGIVALLVNDSGIVSVATMFISGFNLMVLLILREMSFKG